MDFMKFPSIKYISLVIWRSAAIVPHSTDIGVIPYQVTQGLPVQIIDFDEILLI